MNTRKVCRVVNGKRICEDQPSGGLFGSNPAPQPPSPTPVRQTYSQPQPVRVQQNNGNQPMMVAIPPKDIIERTQYGEVERATCKRDPKTNRLRCKIITK